MKIMMEVVTKTVERHNPFCPRNDVNRLHPPESVVSIYDGADDIYSIVDTVNGAMPKVLTHLRTITEVQIAVNNMTGEVKGVIFIDGRGRIWGLKIDEAEIRALEWPKDLKKPPATSLILINSIGSSPSTCRNYMLPENPNYASYYMVLEALTDLLQML